MLLLSSAIDLTPGKTRVEFHSHLGEDGTKSMPIVFLCNADSMAAGSVSMAELASPLG